MYLLAKKLIIYDYLIGKIVQREKEIFHESEDDILSKITSTALMKYQYIVNVLSVRKDSKASLFDLYNNYLAFPHGPVEIDTYYNRHILVRYDMGYDTIHQRPFLQKCNNFRNEQILLFGLEPDQTDNDHVLNQLIQQDGLAAFKTMVDDVFVCLKDAHKFPKYTDVERLINITHQGLWNSANYSVDNRLNVIDHELLNKEKDDICNAIDLA